MPVRALPFYKLSPGGNPTILVHDNALFDSTNDMSRIRATIAKEMMAPDHLGAEQVGFLDTSRILPHIEMMGGEFCLNATRSAAFIFALLNLLPHAPHEPKCHEGEITTSGMNHPLRVRVAAAPSMGSALSPTMTREVAVALHLPVAPELVHYCRPDEILVRLPGITHLLLDTTTHPLPENPLAAAAAKRAEYGLDEEEATGVIWHCPYPEAPGSRRILPVVRVRETGSSTVETACGSGSLALALLLAKNGGNTFTIYQPSGHSITVRFESLFPSGNTILAWVNGIVLLRAQGLAHLDI